MAKKEARRTQPLVEGYLERISSKVLDEFSTQITALIGRRHGVYALYRRDRLYYVGLASNLRGRLRQHLRDRHKGKWDRFSLYLVRHADHIGELESLILRISSPRGNVLGGKLSRAANLSRELQSEIESSFKEKLKDYGLSRLKPEGSSPVSKSKKRARSSSGKGSPTLANYVKKGFFLRVDYKGKTYRASVRKDGTIRVGGEVFTSPTLAAKSITKNARSGWQFWSFKRDGEWVKLDHLRRRKGRNPRP